jgi:acyl carrier protein
MSTLERLQNLLIREYGLRLEAVTPEASLDALGVDSLGMMELLFELEKEFDIVIPNEQVELKTVGQIVAYIDKLTTEQGAPPKLAAS